MVDSTDLQTGQEKRIDFRCSESTKSKVAQVMADIDSDMTYEELMHAVIRSHEENPRRLNKHHY